MQMKISVDPEQLADLNLHCFQSDLHSAFNKANAEFILGLVARKPVFGVSDKTRLKQFSSMTETS